MYIPKIEEHQLPIEVEPLDNNTWGYNQFEIGKALLEG